MDIRFLIEQLDEITRRNFLAGLGAAGLGAAGGYVKNKYDISQLPEIEQKLHSVDKGDDEKTVLQKVGKPDSQYQIHAYKSTWYYDNAGSVTFVNGKANAVIIKSKTVFYDKSVDDEFSEKAKSEKLSVWNIRNKLRRGSSAEEVKKVLGSPDDIRRSLGITYYEYEDPLDSDVDVYFDDDYKVHTITKGWMNTIVDESEETLEETSDEAIARIVELSKDKK